MAGLVVASLALARHLRGRGYTLRLTTRTTTLSKQLLTGLPVLILATDFDFRYPSWFLECRNWATSLSNLIPAPPTPCFDPSLRGLSTWQYGLVSLGKAAGASAFLLAFSLCPSFGRGTVAILQNFSTIILLQSVMFCAQTTVNVRSQMDNILELSTNTSRSSMDAFKTAFVDLAVSCLIVAC